ncbi:MAG: hypothetical protein PHR35_18215, partial [Kiritimatiellae bacterium]|nr:hypothetical protein [Kiritimatiellia bacterium]
SAAAQWQAEPAMTRTQIVEWPKSADLTVKSLTASKVAAAAVEVKPDSCIANPAACDAPGMVTTVITGSGIKVASLRAADKKLVPHKWVSLGFSDGDKNLKLELADDVSNRQSVMELLPKAVQMLEFRVLGQSRASLGVDHSGRAFMEVKKDKMKDLPVQQ